MFYYVRIFGVSFNKNVVLTVVDKGGISVKSFRGRVGAERAVCY